MKKFILLTGLVLAFYTTVYSQSNQYVAVNDTMSITCFKQYLLDPLSNDIYPPGANVEIGYWGPSYNTAWIVTKTSDNKFILTDTLVNYKFSFSIGYTIRNHEDTTQVSDTGYVVVHSQNNLDSLYAVDDTVIFPRVLATRWIDPTTNDVDPLHLDSIYLIGISIPAGSGIHWLNDSAGTNYREYGPDLYARPGIYTGRYLIKRKNIPFPRPYAYGTITFILNSNLSYDYIDTCNLNARINAFGNQFIDFNDPVIGLEIPKGSGKSTVFNSTLWISGLDENDSLHVSAERYRQGPLNTGAGLKSDFFCGPVTNPQYYGDVQDTTWTRVWKITRKQVENHINNWWKQGYVMPGVIIDWPAHGDVSKGQSLYLAPFYDYNADGNYDPQSGDYPVMRGDQAIFFIFNDDRNYHSETEGEPFHAEIQGMAYAFDCPADTALSNSIFFHYDIYNRSDRTYHNTYLGIFSDFDIGYDWDDYMGCDVERNSAFGYNGRETDGTGQPQAYGNHPPAEALTILGGPWMDSDDIDNPKYDLQGNPVCDRSVNGSGFGDSIVDNERLGMSNYMSMLSFIGPIPWWEDNYFAHDYYNRQHSLFKNDSSLIYGGNGYSMAGGYGPACRFIFPGHSDTLNWGLGCVPPNGPKEWTEITAQNNPHDVRGVASMGPFTFHPGDKEELDFAYIFARDMNGNNLQSIEKLRKAIDHINFCFQRDSVCTGKTFSSLENKKKSSGALHVYPNPAGNILNVVYTPLTNRCSYQLITSQGVVIGKGMLDPGKSLHQISLDIPSGLYLLVIYDKTEILKQKVIRL